MVDKRVALHSIVFILCLQATDAPSLGDCAIGLMTAATTTRVVAIVIDAHFNSASIICADEYLAQSCETIP